MKYVTSVKDGKDVKHVVEVNSQNVEVVQLSKAESYGNMKDEQVFLANGIKVSKDFRFYNDSSSYDYFHLAQVVLAIELTRFVIDHLNQGDSK